MPLPSFVPRQPYQRTRSSGSLSKGANYFESASGPIANFNNVINYGIAVGTQKTMTDVVTPGFKQLQALGKVLMSPMSQTEITHDPAASSTGSLIQVYPSYAAGQSYAGTGDQVSQLLGGSNPSTTALPSSMLPVALINGTTVDRAISEACTKAQKLPSDANLLVTLAEMHKTMRLVPDLWTNWAQFFQSFNSRVGYAYGRHLTANPKRQAKQNLQAMRTIVEETWLAMRFGARPLIMDTLGVMKSLQSDISPGPVRVAQRGNVQVFGSDVTSGDYGGIFKAQVVTSTSHDVRVRAVSLFELAVDDLKRKVGLSVGHVPEAVIDLVSFSFVLNWMVTLNDFMSAIGQIVQPGITTIGSCYTVTDQKSVVRQIGNSWCTDPNYVVGSSLTGISTITVNTKYRMVGLRAPSITIRADPFKFLRDFRLIDAIALLSTQLRKGKILSAMR
jgi:hypothetical protein